MAHARTSPTLGIPTYENPGDTFSLPVTRNGVVYRYNSTTNAWESQIGKNVTVVTKVTDATYNHENNEIINVAHKANEELLSIPEIDTNFIDLKKGIVALEKELKYWTTQIQENLDIESGLRAGQANLISDGQGGVPWVNKTGGTFLGAINLDNSITIPANDDSNFFITSKWVQDEFLQLKEHLIPKTGLTVNLGSSASPWSSLFIDNQILPQGTVGGTFQDSQNRTITYYNVNLGSSSAAFKELYVKDAFFSGNTVNIGDASLSATSGGGVLLPQNSSIGSEDNSIPSSFASTLIDERYAKSSGVESLETTFQVTGSVSFLDPVKLLANGTIATINSVNTREAFIGFALAAATSPSTTTVVVHGPISGFTNLTANQLVYLTQGGEITQTKTNTTEKIGLALSSSQIYLFSTSVLDTYIINKNKIEKSDLSVVSTTPSGDGALVYNQSSGVFSMTFPDLSPFATQTYVTNQITNLIDGAPGTLDTLNEISASINDNSNFAGFVTQSLAEKAPKASPSFTGGANFTGVVNAPTPSLDVNSTQVATTAFVQQIKGSQTIEGLTNVTLNSLQQDQVLAYDVATNKFRNVNQSGVGGSATGGTINFIVDGGTAATEQTNIDIFLDGGTA